MKKSIIFASLLFTAHITNALSINDIDKKELDEAIEAYILSHPEIILQSVETYNRKLMAEAEEEQASKLIELLPALRDETNTIVLGNPDADMTIVEFVDYNCGYCRKSHEVLEEILAEDDNLKIVIRQYPILSEGSLETARIALAIFQAHGNEAASNFHNTAYQNANLDHDNAVKIADEIGYAFESYENFLDAPESVNELSNTISLARSLDISGTPAFVIGDELAPGYMDKNVMETMIADIRNRDNS